MDHKQRARWESIRVKGMWRFVLVYGVLWWGGVMVIGTSIYNFFFRPNRFTWIDLRFNIPAMLVGGLLFGVFAWFVNEYQYRKDSSE